MPFENFKSLKLIFFKKVDGSRPRRHVVRDRLTVASGSSVSASRFRSDTVGLIVLVVVDNHSVATLDFLVVYHRRVATFLALLGGTVF
jgi:hypothetical protein